MPCFDMIARRYFRAGCRKNVAYCRFPTKFASIFDRSRSLQNVGDYHKTVGVLSSPAVAAAHVADTGIFSRQVAILFDSAMDISEEIVWLPEGRFLHHINECRVSLLLADLPLRCNPAVRPLSD